MRTPLATLSLLWLIGLAGFVVLCFFASAHNTFAGDISLTRRLQDIDSAVFARALDWTEDTTDFPLVAAVYALVATTLFLLAGWRSALLIAAALLARAMNSGLKEIIERPRPSSDMIDVTDQPSTFSFPSGHTGGSVVLYGLIFYFATGYIPNARLRIFVQAICLWIIVVTAVERVYSGHHWPSDVLGGVLYGILILSALVALHRLVVVSSKQ